MVINYFGGGCFKIQSGNLSLAVDPLNERLKPDILLKTASPIPAESGSVNVVIGPGEYELNGVTIRGFQVMNESTAKVIKTAYLVNMEDISLGFMGELYNVPDAELMEKFGGVDILFLPAGAHPYLDVAKAAKLIKQIGPAIAIPSFFKNAKDLFEEMGQKMSVEEKLTIKKKDIPAHDGTKIICLKE